MRRFAMALMAIAATTQASEASAASIGLTLVPNAWILENYSGNEVTVWTNGTTGACARLHLDTAWTSDDRNRFWSTIMTGKIAQKNVFVYYDDVSCRLISFGLPGV